MVDVFVSYAREDQAFAQRIAQAVAREGYDVWWDDDLPPHLSYGEVITEKIGNAKAAIVVWSHRSAESEWVRAEADLARSQKKLIQTSIDERQPPMPFNQIQFASIGDWKGEPDHPGWKKVKTSLAALCGGAAATGPTAPAVLEPAASRSRRRGHAGRARTGSWSSLGAPAARRRRGGGWYMLRDDESAEVGGKGRHADNGSEEVAATESPSTAPRPASAAFTLAATIDSPDGFMNVRSGPASGFPVVARVNQGEVFTTYQQEGEWWQVRTADSRVGYMSSRYIRPIDPAADAGAADETAEAPAEADVEPAAAPAHVVQVADGAAPPQVFPDSSRRRLTQADVASLSPARIRLARNEIFARHGRIFQDAQLRRHFELYPWYRPSPVADAAQCGRAGQHTPAAPGGVEVISGGARAPARSGKPDKPDTCGRGPPLRPSGGKPDKPDTCGRSPPPRPTGMDGQVREGDGGRGCRLRWSAPGNERAGAQTNPQPSASRQVRVRRAGAGCPAARHRAGARRVRSYRTARSGARECRRLPAPGALSTD